MVFKWTEENERKLLLLALGQSSKPTIDAQEILNNWPDDEKPTRGGAGARFGQLWRQGQIYDFGAGMRDNRRNPIGGGEPVKTTPSRRPSTTNKNTSSRKSSNNGKKSSIPGANNSSQLPATPLKQEQDDKMFSTFTTIGSNGDSNGKNSINSLLTTNGTNSNIKASKKSNPNRAWASRATTSSAATNNKKHKASAMSESESASSTSEDELATPTKTINSSSPIPFVELQAPSPEARRPSLPRRSKSATPGKAAYTEVVDGMDDGTGKDDAAKEIDSDEEWNGDDEGTPSKKVKRSWRERTGLKDGDGGEEED